MIDEKAMDKAVDIFYRECNFLPAKAGGRIDLTCLQHAIEAYEAAKAAEQPVSIEEKSFKEGFIKGYDFRQEELECSDTGMKPDRPGAQNLADFFWDSYDESNSRTAEQPDEPPYKMGEFRIQYFNHTITEIIHLPTGQTFRPAERKSREVDQLKAVKVMLAACEGLEDLEDCMTAAFAALDNSYRIEGERK